MGTKNTQSISESGRHLLITFGIIALMAIAFVMGMGYGHGLPKETKKQQSAKKHQSRIFGYGTAHRMID